MKMKLRNIILLGVCLAAAILAPLSGHTAIYYVDMSAGTDANNGTSTNSAWQHCPGDTNSTAVPRGTVLHPGDTVVFKGGVAYTNTMIAKWSGTPGNPIIYDGNSSGNWGSSNAIIDEQYLNPVCFNIATNGNLTLNNFIVQHAGGLPISQYSNYSPPTNYLPSRPGYGLYLTDTTNVTIQNCIIQQIGYWTNTYPMSANLERTTWGVYAYSSIGLLITNCHFTAENVGLAISSGYPARTLVTSNVVVTGCDFSHFLIWCIAISPSSESVALENIVITNCALHDYPELWQGYWTGYGGNAAAPHLDGIIVGVSTAFTNMICTNNVIAGNSFYWNSTNGGGTSYIFMCYVGGQWSIYNNLCANEYNGEGCFYIQDGAFGSNYITPLAVNFYNNTFVAPSPAIWIRWIATNVPSSDPGLGMINIANNIFYVTNANSSAYCINIQGTSNGPAYLDYNIYFDNSKYNSTGGVFNWMTNSTSRIFTFAQMQSQLGVEQHGFNADPLFHKFSYGLGFNSSLNDFTLNEVSCGKGAGRNLATYFSMDKNGLPRFASGTWTMGAYTYSFPPPSNLRVVPPQ
jgi:hypothetical protein